MDIGHYDLTVNMVLKSVTNVKLNHEVDGLS